jgi:antitoxin (DNA-binding transcriptional repressor) of toxin-antitoxin stability system
LKRTPYILTKNGRKVAQIIPMPLEKTDPIFGFYKGKLEILGDILSPLYSDEELDGFERQAAENLR